MDESKLLLLIISLLDAGIAAYAGGPTPLPVGLTAQRAFQPRQQGAPVNPAIVVNHTGSVLRGNARRTSVWDASSSSFVYTYSQRMESTYHFEAIVPQSPEDYTAMTEADVLNVARFIVQNDTAISTLLAAPGRVSLLRVTKMDSNYIEDDKDQNENVPFFEVTFQYRWSVVSSAPTVESFTTSLHRE